MTTKEDIKEWFENGVSKGATYLFILCDQWDYSYFPSYAYSNDEANEKLLKYESGENMTKLMEIYDLKQNMEKQLNFQRSWAEIIK